MGRRLLLSLGSFQQVILGFGVNNGPPSYCWLVEMVLRGIPPSVAIGFLDDGLIHASSLQDYILNLRRVLSAYQEAGLKLSPAKCTFFTDRIVLLGHKIQHNGIHPAYSHIQGVKGWPILPTKSQARAFLGLTNYYRGYIKDYAQIAAPWTCLLYTSPSPRD